MESTERRQDIQPMNRPTDKTPSQPFTHRYINTLRTHETNYA